MDFPEDMNSLENGIPPIATSTKIPLQPSKDFKELSFKFILI
jgi:hypothetical protein